jgi:hypothetical protein
MHRARVIVGAKGDDVVVADARLVVAEPVLDLFDADLALFSVIPFSMSLRK